MQLTNKQVLFIVVGNAVLSGYYYRNYVGQTHHKGTDSVQRIRMFHLQDMTLHMCSNDDDSIQ